MRKYYRKDCCGCSHNYAKGGEVWDKPRPKGLGKPNPMSARRKMKAKELAKSGKRPYPNLVDNMRASM